MHRVGKEKSFAIRSYQENGHLEKIYENTLIHLLEYPLDRERVNEESALS